MAHPGAGMLTALLALSALAVDITLAALPATATALGAEPLRSGLIVTAYLAGFAPGQLLWGLLADRIGRRPALLIGLAAFVAATVACALASSFGMLLAARAAQGLAGGSAPVLARVIVRDVASGVEGARLFAGMMTVVGLAPLLAPLVGAALLAQSGWTSMFWASSLYGMVLLVLVALRLPETRPAGPSVSSPGALARLTARLLAQRDYRIGVALVALPFSGYHTILALYPGIAIVQYGVSESRFALLFAAAAACYVAGALLSRLLVLRTGERALMVSAITCCLAGAAMVAAASAGGGLPWLAFGTSIFVLGVGQMLPVATAFALRHVGAAAGWAVAMLGLLQIGAGALLSYTASVVGKPSTNLPVVLTVCGLAAVPALARIGRDATAPAPEQA